MRPDLRIVDVTLLERAKHCGDLAVGLQTADVDPESLGDLALLHPLPRNEPFFAQLRSTAAGGGLVVEGADDALNGSYNKARTSDVVRP